MQAKSKPNTAPTGAFGFAFPVPLGLFQNKAMIKTKTKPKKKTKRRRKDGKECHDNDDVLGCNQWLGMPTNELHTKNKIKLPYFTGRFVYFLVLNTILDFEKSASAHAKNRVSPVRI